MTKLCLVRHGQTDWNLQGRYQGQSDVPLNQIGLAQAHTLVRQLQGQTFAAIYSSDLKRAGETALIIADAMHLPVNFEARLREINQGEWEGQLVDKIRARYENLWQMRSVDPAGLRPPGGETVSELAERLQAALDEIAHLHPGLSVLIVSHGLALATVLCKVRGIPIGQAYTVIPENAEPVWVEWKEV
jgi:broad specificity phosphatase PhoE